MKQRNAPLIVTSIMYKLYIAISTKHGEATKFIDDVQSLNVIFNHKTSSKLRSLLIKQLSKKYIKH